MPEDMQSLWDDSDFTIETGSIGVDSIIAAERGPGLIYYPSAANIRPRLADTFLPNSKRQPRFTELDVFWSDGSGMEILDRERSDLSSSMLG